MRICEAEKCDTPVFGTCKITRKGYCKRHQSLREDFDKRSLTQKAISKINKQKTNTLSRNLKEVQDKVSGGRQEVSIKGLMVKADKVFSEWIRNRDAVMGKVKCVCCGREYGLKDKDDNGNVIIQNLHFVSRKVYSRRYSEMCCRAGCTWCNNSMDKEPAGLAYQQFRAFLVSETDEFTVSQIENERYKVNRISHSYLQEVIKKYSK